MMKAVVTGCSLMLIVSAFLLAALPSAHCDEVATTMPSTSTLGGGVFVVAPDGDDRNPGTVLQPWKTLQKAAYSVQPGDAVFVRKGQYAAGLIIKRSGTAESPIRFRNFPGEEPVIDGRREHYFGILLHQVRFIHVRGFSIRNIIQDRARKTRDKPGYSYPPGGIALIDSSDNVVEGNMIRTGGERHSPDEIEVGATGIRLYSANPSKGCHRNLLRGNECFHCSSGAHILGPGSGNMFEGNLFRDNQELREHSDGAGQDALRRVAGKTPAQGEPPVTPRASIYRYNVCTDNSDDGLDMWVSTGNLIEYNFVSGSGMGPKKGDGNGYKMGPGGRNTIRYCLAYRNRARAFDDNAGGNNTWQNNVAFGNGSPGAKGATVLKTEDEWKKNKLRQDIQRRIDAFRDGLVETIPPGPPGNVQRTAAGLTWTAPAPAEDGDVAVCYLIFADERVIAVTYGESFALPPGVKGQLSVCSVDDSYRDNQSGRVNAAEPR
ncbi:MAG: NosD domain-containing protein [Planctomycetaceae bacterium]|nr:right-handed parallel beta-helix repeat-containing protein [Planctomycetaceae bacterium]